MRKGRSLKTEERRNERKPGRGRRERRRAEDFFGMWWVFDTCVRTRGNINIPTI